MDESTGQLMLLSAARVAWLQPILGRNGDLMYMGPILKGLARASKEFRAFTARYDGDPASQEIAITATNTLKTIQRNSASDYPVGVQLVHPGIIKDILKYEPDLLVLNEFSMLTLYGCLIKIIRPRTRALLIVENRPYPSNAHILHSIKQLYRRLLVRFPDKVLTNNLSSVHYLSTELGLNKKKIICSPYLVSDMTSRISALPDRAARERGAPIRFLYVGQLIDRKGVHLIIDAAARLLQQHRGRFVVDVVGDGPSRAALQKRTEDLGLQTSVFFHGRQPYEKLGEYYAKADAFLFPTLNDYRALAPFEALTMGLPLLSSTRDGGSSESVIPGENGFTFDPYNPSELPDLMAQMIDNPEVLQRFSKKSREMSLTYTLDNAMANLERACFEAMNTL